MPTVLRRFRLSHALLLLPLSLALYGNRFLYLGDSQFSDLAISHYPNLLYLRRALLEWGQVPLWSPAILSGYPFFANPLAGLWYPPGWLALVLPLPWGFHLLAGLHLAWGAAGLYAFMRKQGAGHWAALLAGMAFGMLPKAWAHYAAGHLTLVYALSWTPWLLWATGLGGRWGRWLPGVLLAVVFYADVRWAAYAGLLWLGWCVRSQFGWSRRRAGKPAPGQGAGEVRGGRGGGGKAAHSQSGKGGWRPKKYAHSQSGEGVRGGEEGVWRQAGGSVQSGKAGSKGAARGEGRGEVRGAERAAHSQSKREGRRLKKYAYSQKRGGEEGEERGEGGEVVGGQLFAFNPSVRFPAIQALISNFQSAISVLPPLLLAAALAAPLALPLLEFTRLSTRAALTPQDVLVFSLPPARLLGLLFPDTGGLQEWVVYPGGGVLLLALIGLGWPVVRGRGAFWWWVFAAAVLFSLGGYLPGMSLVARLPGMSLLRVPARAFFLAGMALAVLAGLAFDGLIEGVPRRGRRRAARLVFFWAALAGGFALGVWLVARRLPFAFGWGAAVALLAALGASAALSKRVPRPVWVGLLIGVCVIDWGVVNVRGLSPRPRGVVFSQGEAAAVYLARQEGRFRVYSPSYSLPQLAAARYGLELADGVDPLQLAGYAAYLSAASGVPWRGYSVTLPALEGEVASANAGYTPDADLLGLLNVRFVLAAFDLQAEGLVLRERFGGTRVYENVRARGPGWVQPAGSPLGTVGSPAQVEWSPNRIRVWARGPGLLVLSEVAYPGWRAAVDGRPAQLERAGIFRAVRLPPGGHEVVFTFRPWSLYVGLGIFAFAVVFLSWRVFLGPRAVRRVSIMALRVIMVWLLPGVAGRERREAR